MLFTKYRCSQCSSFIFFILALFYAILYQLVIRNFKFVLGLKLQSSNYSYCVEAFNYSSLRTGLDFDLFIKIAEGYRIQFILKSRRKLRSLKMLRCLEVLSITHTWKAQIPYPHPCPASWFLYSTMTHLLKQNIHLIH